MQRGKLITLSGGEGCGKTTHVDSLYDWLSSLGYDCLRLREPGGVLHSEEMRTILKNTNYTIDAVTEMFGFNFARSGMYNDVLIPEYQQGKIILTDRSGIDTEAYQGYGGGQSLDDIRTLNRIATRGINPDLAIIIDIDPKKGLAKEIEKDRISSQGLEYHKRVRQGFLEIAKRENYPIISYREGDLRGMQEEIRKLVQERVLNPNL